jgi:hypothetical protein
MSVIVSIRLTSDNVIVIIAVILSVPLFRILFIFPARIAEPEAEVCD